MEHFFSFLDCSHTYKELWRPLMEIFYATNLAFDAPVMKIVGHLCTRCHTLVHFTSYVGPFSLHTGGKVDQMAFINIEDY